VLEELVNKNAPGVFQVTGKLNQPNFTPAGNLIVSYNRQPQVQSRYVVIPGGFAPLDQSLPSLPPLPPMQQLPQIQQLPTIQSQYMYYPEVQPSLFARGPQPDNPDNANMGLSDLNEYASDDPLNDFDIQ